MKHVALCFVMQGQIKLHLVFIWQVGDSFSPIYLDVHLMYLSEGCGGASQSSAEVCGTKATLSRKYCLSSREDREKNAECYLI